MKLLQNQSPILFPSSLKAWRAIPLDRHYYFFAKKKFRLQIGFQFLISSKLFTQFKT